MKRAWTNRGVNLLFLPVMAALMAPVAGGQQPLAQMYHRAWTAKDGAPNDITNVAHGPDGFLWLTTEDGLFRFDGLTFSRFRPAKGSALPSNRMEDILVASDGAVWVSYPLGGVSRIQGNKVTNFSEQDGLRGSRFPNLAMGKDGSIWIVGTRGIEYIRDSKPHTFEDHSGIARVVDESVVVDSAGNVWVNPASRLMVLPYGTKDFLPASGDPFYGCNAAYDEGVLCRSTTKALTHFTLAEGKITSRPLLHPASSYWNTLGAKDGSLWIATDRNGVERIPSEKSLTGTTLKPEFFSRKDGLTSDRALTVVEDREGSVWVVTDRGLDQFRPVPFHAFEMDVPVLTLPSNDVGEPFLIATNRLAAFMQDGLHDLSSPRLVPGYAGSIHRMDNGSVWAWVSDQLLRYQHGNVESMPLPDGAGFGSVQTIVEDALHNVWVSSTREGLYRWDGKRWDRRGGKTGLPDGTAYAALRDSRGDLWFGFREGVLSRLSSDQITVFSGPSGPNVGDVRTLAERDHHIWIGGERGVAFYDEGRFRVLALDGDQPLNDVSGLVFVKNGDLWINSSSGVFRVSKDEIDRQSSNLHYNVAWRRFNYLDGIDGIPSITSGNPSAALAADGKLYMATNRRLQWIDPTRLPTNPTPPTVWITGVRAEGKDVTAATAPIHLSKDTRNLEIAYTAPSLLIPERVRFRYRLAGYEADWIDAGVRRKAFYAKLPPGQYTFEVIACNDSGVWSPKATSVALIVPPTFLETIWFKVGLLLLAVGSVLVFVRLRLNQAKRRLANQMYEVLGERHRIARDLHDTLLQGVQALMFKVSVATKKLPPTEPMRPVLEETLTQSDLVLLEGRSLIANLQTQEESSKVLLASLRLMGEELRSDYPSTRFAVDTADEDRLLSSLVITELRNTGREALTNAFRHADAAHIKLTVQATPQELRLVISDDGRGIDAEVLARGYRSGHWGLRNMRERTERLGGRFTVASLARAGTTIQVSIPAFVAYKDAPKGLRERLHRWFS